MYYLRNAALADMATSDALSLANQLHHDWRSKYSKPAFESYFSIQDAQNLLNDDFKGVEDFRVVDLTLTLLSPPPTLPKAKAAKLADMYQTSGVCTISQAGCRLSWQS